MCDHWISALIEKNVPIHKRPYGYMLILQGPYEKGANYNKLFDLKVLIIEPGMKTSYHKHSKSRTIILPLKGSSILITNGRREIIEPGDIKIIKKNIYHQILNVSNQRVLILESMYPPYNKKDIFLYGGNNK